MSVLTPPKPATETATLEKNLAALGLRSPRVADAVRRARPSPGLRWTTTEQDGAWSAELDGRALASRRRPIDEGRKLAESVDFTQAGAAAVLGFGLGYHVAALVERGGPRSAMLIFEPDVALLRAVMERADFSAWLRGGLVFFFTDAQSAAAINERLAGMEALIGLGVQIVEHAPSRARLGASGAIFAETLTKFVASTRTQVVTTMMQMEVTVRNLLMNVDHYTGLTGASGIADLAHAAKGRPAIVIAAGPSLERNIDLLTNPAVRDQFVIIAVQTVLKQLLAKGIKPHFVTALDYHEVSTRFYEGLAAADVKGVTLVAEPKANPAILQAFPGTIRVAGAETLDALLGAELAGEHGTMPPGATVAHLAYYLARHIGCDPVVLVGQDLAFTDGQYYSAGAAIHDVWATELNPFNTLEMMEWQRIVRWRGHLHTLTDHLGRSVYTDDQMSTYLAQFERDFLADSERGLTIIDATEGGARKAHTRAMPLLDAIAQFGKGIAPRSTPAAAGKLWPQREELNGIRPDSAPFEYDTHGIKHRRTQSLSSPPSVPGACPPRRVFSVVQKRLALVRDDVKKIAYLSRQAQNVLELMLDTQHDQARTNRLIEEVQSLRGRVEALQPAYGLVQRLNQAGAFKRFRADRALGFEDDLAPLERQKRQIQRDIMNVGWIADAADSLEDLLGATLAMLDGAPKRTRDAAPARDDATNAASAVHREPVNVGAVMILDSEHSDLPPTIAGESIFLRTLGRLSRCQRLGGVVLLTDDPERARALCAAAPVGLAIHTLTVDPTRLRRGRESIRAARAWAPTSWRGGLGNLTCYDEEFDAGLTEMALEQFQFSAALIVGPDWCALDPTLCDRVIERHAENPDALPFTFTQAPPGLAGVVVSARLCRDLEAGRAANDHSATLGGMLGYRPTHARPDAIVQACCVQIPHTVRSAAHRFIADSVEGIALAECSTESAETSALAAGAAFTDLAARFGPQHLILELNTERATRCGISAVRAPMILADAGRILTAFASMRPGGAITLAGAGDPLLHQRLPQVISAAKSLNLRVHVRTDLLAPKEAIDAMLAARPDVISVDLYATADATYRALTGVDRLREALLSFERLLEARVHTGGLPTPWVIPRITRRDATYAEIEGFFDRGLFFAGACVIDPLSVRVEDERIAPLPKPRVAQWRDALTRIMVLADGSVVTDETDATGVTTIGNARREPLATLWNTVVERRLAAWSSGDPAHPDLRTGC